MKKAMLAVRDRLAERKMQARMLLTVHDELVFECPPEELDAASEIVRREMQGAYPELKVPLLVDIGTGPNWRDAK
jgi:DNA polymerase-1